MNTERKATSEEYRRGHRERRSSVFLCQGVFVFLFSFFKHKHAARLGSNGMHLAVLRFILFHITFSGTLFLGPPPPQEPCSGFTNPHWWATSCSSQGKPCSRIENQVAVYVQGWVRPPKFFALDKVGLAPVLLQK